MEHNSTKKGLTPKQENFIEDKISSNASIMKLCEKHGIGRTTYWRWSKQKAFSEAMKEAEESYIKQLVDMAQIKIGELAESGNITSLIFILKSKGGWVETSGIDMKMKTPIIEVRNQEQKRSIEKMVQRVKKSE